MDHTASIRTTLEKANNKSDSSLSKSSSSSANEPDVVKKLTQLRKKVDNLDETIQSRLAVITNEVFLKFQHPFQFEYQRSLINWLMLGYTKTVELTGSN